MNNLLVKNVLLIDGSGSPARKEQVFIENGVFSAFGKDAEACAKVKPHVIVDGNGCVMTPGFIDLHRHCDYQALSPEFGSIELAQGIITVLCGPCGMAAWPTPNDNATAIQYADFVRPCLGQKPNGADFNSFDEYIKAVRAKELGVNLGALAGAGAIQVAVKGFGSEPYTKRQMDQANTLLYDALSQGAYGLSMGLMYTPECYISSKERLEFLRPLRDRGVLFCHIRGEGDLLVESVAEVVEIAQEAEVPLQISHFKATGLKNWGRELARAIDIIENARSKGQDITVDFYPYEGGATTLLSLLPPVLMENGAKAAVKNLATEEGCIKLAQALTVKHPGWDNMLQLIGPERIMLASSECKDHEKYVGKSLNDISEECGGISIASTIAKLVIESEGMAGALLMSMDPDDVRTVAKLPYSMLISDSLYNMDGAPHPRLFGSFPKFLRQFVLQDKVMSLEAAINKMTGLPAWRAGMNTRGIIKQGAQADFVLFNPTDFIDNATYKVPKQPATGLRAVYISGQMVWQGETILERKGRFLYKGK